MAMIAYARVSTGEQSTGPQIEALRAAGCDIIIEEHASGGARERPQLRKAIERCRKGDVLVVVRIDRLARSLAHLLDIIDELDRKGAGFRSLGDPIDTTSPQGRFTLQILGAVAEFERALIRERTIAGLRDAVTNRGKKPGNPGIIRRDPAAIAKAARARDELRDAKLLAGAEPVIELLHDLRPNQPWDVVVRRLNALKVPRPSGGAWTRDSIIRAARRLARDGFIPAAALDPAPKRRGSDDLIDVIAGLVKGMTRRGETPTLAAIARALEEMRQRTPRGGSRWTRSSVKSLLDRAKEQGLVEQDACT